MNGDARLIEEADKAVSYVAENQRADGAWGYSKDDGREWTDNFHTGYILDCFDEYAECTGKRDYDETLRKGYRYYSENFFEEKETDGRRQVLPKYYNNSLYPTDSTAAAQSIMTLCRFGDTDKAAAALDYVLANMFSDKNYFYYRAGRTGKKKTSYMRWSNAWMFCAMAYLYYKMKSTGNDLV
ncbi:MAG: hypothetical protein LWX07_09060 [Bacteroidetes bacterium]|nr:hypothetical protein [Bacteroidota bacterium]